MRRVITLLVMAVFFAATAKQRSLIKTDPIDYFDLKPPQVGDSALHVLTPNLLEVVLINTKDPSTSSVSQWDLVDGSAQFQAPAASSFVVTVDGQPITVSAVGFKRRPLYA